MYKKSMRIGIAALTLAQITGCMNLGSHSRLMKQSVDEVTAKSQSLNEARITEKRGRYVPRATESEEADIRNTVTMKVSQANLFQMVQNIAKKEGLTTIAGDAVDINKRVNVDIIGMDPIQAIRQIAYLGGYVAVLNKLDKTITIADQASFTFRVPTDVLKKMDAKYSIGGNPTGGSGGGSSGGGGSSSGGGRGSPIKAEFTIEGQTSNSTANFQMFLQKLAGQNAVVQVYSEQGLIMVRSNGQAMKRVSDFLQAHVFDAMRQVEVSTYMVEVDVSDEFQYGIQWNKLLTSGGNKFSYDTTSAVTGAANAISAGAYSITNASISSIITALQTTTEVKVVANPSLVISNHSSATIFDGTQIPYLPSVQTTVTGTSGTSQTSGTAAYVLDGVSLSTTVDILDNTNVAVTLVPVTAQVQQMVSFLGGQVMAPKLATKQGFIQVPVQNGKTVILGGNRYKQTTNATTGLPLVTQIPYLGKVLGGTNDNGKVTEFVILLRATVLPGNRIDFISTESL